MKLIDNLRSDLIYIADNCRDTTALYHEFSHFLRERGVIQDARLVKRLFVKRESIQSTGINRGAAAPHIFSSEFSKFILTAALIRQGLDFQSPDGQPVHLVFLIMSDDRDVGLHLKALAHIARLVAQTDVVEAVRAARDPDELYAILQEKEKAIPT
jgi:mannitol/fructose-specific phosphotransferase system IIA component (Ntr-type)